MPQISEYLALITSQYRQQPKFTEMVSTDVSLPVRIQNLMLSMIPLFDVDAAVGDQLDIIGQWVGISRNISVPIPAIYFSWDSGDAKGWEYGTWQGSDDPSSITVLPDDTYRQFVKAKIAANQWDGTTEGAYRIWDSVFTDISIVIKDNQDMTYDLGFIGGTISSLTLALVLGGYIPLKPEGVRLNGVFVPANDGPLFAWDSDTNDLKGWDEGSWVTFYPAP